MSGKGYNYELTVFNKRGRKINAEVNKDKKHEHLVGRVAFYFKNKEVDFLKIRSIWEPEMQDILNEKFYVSNCEFDTKGVMATITLTRRK